MEHTLRNYGRLWLPQAGPLLWDTEVSCWPSPPHWLSEWGKGRMCSWWRLPTLHQSSAALTALWRMDWDYGFYTRLWKGSRWEARLRRENHLKSYSLKTLHLWAMANGCKLQPRTILWHSSVMLLYGVNRKSVLPDWLAGRAQPSTCAAAGAGCLDDNLERPCPNYRCLWKLLQLWDFYPTNRIWKMTFAKT